MLKILPKDIFFFKAVKTNTANILQHYPYPLSKTRKLLLLLIPGNTGDRAFSAPKTRIPTEYKEKL